MRSSPSWKLPADDHDSKHTVMIRRGGERHIRKPARAARGKTRIA